MEKRKILLSFLGPACVLIGLFEISRLIIIYSANYRMFVGFPLEIGIYMVGMVWTIRRYAEDIREVIEKPRSILVDADEESDPEDRQGSQVVTRDKGGTHRSDMPYPRPGDSSTMDG